MTAKRFAADLIWALTSPPIITLNDQHPDPLWDKTTIMGFVQQLNTQGIDASTVTAPPARLGIYFEQLIHYYLTHSPLIDQIHDHIPVRADGRTLGEFDFIYRGQDESAFTHLEVAAKFFLALSGGEQASDWIGLNPTDSLATKINRMRQQQLPLAVRPEAVHLLAERQIHVKHSWGWIKGRLFYPWQDFKSQSYRYPSDLNPQHLKGWWVRQSELSNAFAGELFYRLDRTHWLAQLAACTTEPVRSSELSFNEQLLLNRPLMVARVQKQPECTAYIEIDRGIIIPDLWPV